MPISLAEAPDPDAEAEAEEPVEVPVDEEPVLEELLAVPVAVAEDPEEPAAVVLHVSRAVVSPAYWGHSETMLEAASLLDEAQLERDSV